MRGAKGKWCGVGAALVMAMGLSGCASDLYAPCDLDPQSNNPTQRSCAMTGGDAKISCAVENFLQCEGTSVCGRYQGSDTFCTQACVQDADCAEGQCRDFNIITPGSARYCVPPEVVNQ